MVVVPALADVIARVPVLRDAGSVDAQPLARGLTNINYLVTADGVRYVVRIADPGAGILGIDRARETRVLDRVVAAGISPETVAFLLPEGHHVTRYLADADPLSIDEFTAPAMVPRVAERLRDIHRLDPIEGAFDPYSNIRRWRAILEDRGTPPPGRLEALLEVVTAIEAERRAAGALATALCHNDPYYTNFLADDTLWVIDWEYAGMGDPMYDVAGVAYALDAAGRDRLLETYLGGPDAVARRLLDRMVAVYLCWNILWSLVQVGVSAIDFDYAGFAEDLLARIPEFE